MSLALNLGCVGRRDMMCEQRQAGGRRGGQRRRACLGGRQREVERMTRRPSPLSAGVTVAPQILSRCRVLLPHTLLALPSKRTVFGKQTGACLYCAADRQCLINLACCFRRRPPPSTSTHLPRPPTTSYSSFMSLPTVYEGSPMPFDRGDA